MFEAITKRSFGFNLLLVIGLFIVLGILFFSLLGGLTRHGQTRTVPDVRGKNVQEATKMLEQLGFEVDVRDSIYIDTLKALAVWEQTPAKGAIVKVNRTIYLTINKVVPPMVAMPDLEGLTFRSAEMTLHSRRLNVGDTIYKPDFATNTVLQQMLNGKTIKPGKMVPEGSYIALVLSSGTGSTENPVPDLVGMTYLEAKETLSASNLNLGTVLIDAAVSDTANAYIQRQIPARKNDLNELNRVRAGESVDIWLGPNKPVKDTVPPPVQPAAQE